MNISAILLWSLVSFVTASTSSSASKDEESSDESQSPVKLYSKARIDRSGRQFVLFIYLDAMAFHQGLQLGGACPPQPKPNDPKRMQQLENINATKQLLDFLGLQELFPYACPSASDLDQGLATFDDGVARLSPTQYITPDWYAFFQTRIAPLLVRDGRPRPKKKLAVHVRRGDITPCTWPNRYLPNSFYLKALDMYLPEHCGEGITDNCDVTIFSEADPAESFDPFLARGYGLELNSSVAETWFEFIHADVFFMSISHFSYGAALLNRHHVIYVERVDEGPLPDWIVIERQSALFQEAGIERNHLIDQHCGANRRLLR